MPRLFVATATIEDLDTGPVLEALGDGRGIKPVDPSQYHITLAFLGEVYPRRVDDAIEAVEQADYGVAPHEGRVHGLGAFPRPSRASVVWAGAKGTELDAVAGAVRESLGKRNLSFDARDFHAHLTLARLRAKANVTDLVERFEDTDFGGLPVEAVHLYESTLTPGGPEYQVLAGAELGGGA